MSNTLARRLAALTGLAISAAIACWWLGSSRLALDDRSDTGRAAADALMLTGLVRAIALSMLSLRGGVLRGWRQGSTEALALVSPSWPLVALAWSASTVPWSHAVLMELVLCAIGGVLALIGERVGTAIKQKEVADSLAVTIGVALAVTLWMTRSFWVPPLS